MSCPDEQLYDGYPDFKFYKKFVNPDPLKRAKIYRALSYSTESMKDIIVFTFYEGLIIGYKSANPNFDFNFNLYLSQDCIFIPEGYDKLNHYNYLYYHRLLTNFVYDEQISGKIIRMNERDDIFSFSFIRYIL